MLEHTLFGLLTFTVLWKGGKTLESTWLLLGVGALCSILLYLKHNRHRTKTPPANGVGALLLLFLLWTAASYFFSSTQNYGLDELLRTGGLVLLFLWLVEWHGPRFINGVFEKRFFSLLTFLTVLACLIGVLVYAGQPVNRFVGTFFDPRFHTDYWPNAFAQYLLLTWPIVLLVSGTRIERKKTSLLWYHTKDKMIRYFPIGFTLGSLFLTYSRGALIAFLGQIALLTLLLWKQRGTGKSITSSLRHIAAALLIGFFVFTAFNEVRSAFFPVQSVTEKVTFQATEGRSSVNERVAFWGQSAYLALKKPLFGWGAYSFRFVQPRLQRSVLATSDHPHNVFLKLAMERGVIASLLFALFVFLIVRSGIRNAVTGKRLSQSTDHVRLGHALLTVSIAGVLAHNLIDYNLQFVGIALPFWLIMAIIFRHSTHQPVHHAIERWLPQRRMQFLCALLAVLLLTVAFREGSYLVTSSFGRHAEARGESEKALAWYQQSSDEWFTRDMRLSQVHLYLHTGQMEQASSSVEAYLERNREDARAWKLKGQVALENQDFTGAIHSYERALRLGGWNDIGISRGLLETLFALSYTKPTSDAAADSKRLPLHPRIEELIPDLTQLAEEFASAIQWNTHFVALSPNVEETIKVLIMLSVLLPERAEEFRSLTADVEQHAADERSKILARPPGWLW